MSDEVRITDAVTGGQKGSKLARFSLIPPEFLWALAEHYGKGAKKYEDRNWEKGYKWSLTVDALDRHWTAWKMGENIDADTGSHHMIAVAWHAIALFIYQLRGLGTNDIQPIVQSTIDANPSSTIKYNPQAISPGIARDLKDRYQNYPPPRKPLFKC